MYIQEFIGIFYLGLVTIYVIFIGFFAWATSKRSERKFETDGGKPEVRRGMEQKEKKWLAFLLLVAIAGNAILLSPIIPSAKVAIWSNPTPTKIVSITIKDYKFYLPENPIKVEVGRPVQFLVKSKDVTYGFGVFRSDGSLVFQMQVLPNYDNRITWIFDEPGLYTIRSTEYSGPRHSEMVIHNAIIVEEGGW